VFEGKERTYIPDFIVNNKLIEIKGFVSDQWIAKLTYNPDVVVIDEKKIQPHMDYVTEKYGKDFIVLYE